MSKYLYGAAVQGIQGFIFQTNKLAEIIGASELVESICTTFFKEKCPSFNDDNLIMGAAGNIKYIFSGEEDCKQVVREFPKEVMTLAPGITISQAIVRLDNDYPTSDELNQLEKKLKAQRNIVSKPFETGYMVLNRARKTGGVAFTEIKDRKNNTQIVDEATFKKLSRVKFKEGNSEEFANEKLFKKFSGLDVHNKDIAFDIEDISKTGKNSWIAVIHADGNGLGNILQNYGKIITDNQEFKLFSELIQTATESACQQAFMEVISKEKKDDKRYPVRPVIIGGDDVTIIIRADLALNFTTEFLKSFEIITSEKFNILQTANLHGGLTACAGIAYVKDSYPLHYALSLAEQLCKDAKKLVKNEVSFRNDGMPKSALALFKVQDSFVEDLKTMKARTMKTNNGIDYDYGPYLLRNEVGFANIQELDKKLQVLKEEADKKDKSKAVSKLRQLISESFKDKEAMNIMKARMKSVNEMFYDDLGLDSDLKGKSILYDLIQLHSFKY